jgi:hypothetical protein
MEVHETFVKAFGQPVLKLGVYSTEEKAHEAYRQYRTLYPQSDVLSWGTKRIRINEYVEEEVNG